MSARQVMARVLLAFVIFSVGYAVGKEVALRRMAAATGHPDPNAGPAPAEAGKLVALYLHATFRCVTCNRIEALAKAVVEKEFAPEVAAGRLEWRVANFQAEPELARRYEIGTSSLVLSRLAGGREIAFKRLDEVWNRVGDEASFNQYVAGEIRALLPPGGAP
mgnify:CR=1 FL=1